MEVVFIEEWGGGSLFLCCVEEFIGEWNFVIFIFWGLGGILRFRLGFCIWIWNVFMFVKDFESVKWRGGDFLRWGILSLEFILMIVCDVVEVIICIYRLESFFYLWRWLVKVVYVSVEREFVLICFLVLGIYCSGFLFELFWFVNSNSIKLFVNLCVWLLLWLVERMLRGGGRFFFLIFFGLIVMDDDVLLL